MGSGRRRVAWSDGALRQLDEGISYIAEDSIGSAVRVLELILESTESLRTMNEMPNKLRPFLP